MKSSIINRLRAGVEEWTRIHDVKPSLIEVKFSGVGSFVHVLVVARHGFENWRWSERDRSLIGFISSKVSRNGDFFIGRLESRFRDLFHFREPFILFSVLIAGHPTAS